LERREIVGGACVTEEIIPGFAFSRASYLLSLLRPQIVRDLKLKDYGLELYLRNFSSFTPLLGSMTPEFLLLGRDMAESQRQIAKFSIRDSKAYERYQMQMCKYADAIQLILDCPPPSPRTLSGKGWWTVLSQLHPIKQLAKSMRVLGQDVTSFYKLVTGPASSVENTGYCSCYPWMSYLFVSSRCWTCGSNLNH
jgi:phytoene dehydrogenase-like protein